MRQLQSRVQRICVPARGQEVSTAEAARRPELGRESAMRKLTEIRTAFALPIGILRSFYLHRLICLASFFAATFIASSYAQISFGGPDERFINDIDRIHQGDILEVDVVGSFEFDWRGSLNPEGFIDGIERIPEPIFARCSSTATIANAIAEKFRTVLRDPVVEVRIIDRNGRAISYIDGAIKNPMRMRIRRDVHLDEVIVLAGGFTDLIGSEITVFRPLGTSCEGARSGTVPIEPTTDVIKIADLLAGAEGANRKIVPGDVVTVVKSLPIYVIGGVGNPQRLAAREGLSVSRAIDSAGGISKNGRRDSISIYRRSGGQTKVILVDLEKIRSGTAEDPLLEANDIVEVPFKGSPKRDSPPVVEFRETDTAQMPLRIIE